jgi:hypothetical protein
VTGALRITRRPSTESRTRATRSPAHPTSAGRYFEDLEDRPQGDLPRGDRCPASGPLPDPQRRAPSPSRIRCPRARTSDTRSFHP